MRVCHNDNDNDFSATRTMRTALAAARRLTASHAPTHVCHSVQYRSVCVTRRGPPDEGFVVLVKILVGCRMAIGSN